MGQPTPIEIAGHSFDPDTIALLESVLDEIWAELTETQRNQTPRSLITDWLLQAAADRERDRHALRLYALSGIEPAVIPEQAEGAAEAD